MCVSPWNQHIVVPTDPGYKANTTLLSILIPYQLLGKILSTQSRVQALGRMDPSLSYSDGAKVGLEKSRAGNSPKVSLL